AGATNVATNNAKNATILPVMAAIPPPWLQRWKPLCLTLRVIGERNIQYCHAPVAKFTSGARSSQQ
ncbi:MAG: hypothetical protein ABI377_08445, partial [Devosia sp.]